MRQVTTRACLNHIRDHRQGPEPLSLDDQLVQTATAPEDGDPERQAILAWDRAQLERALEALPPAYRMVVVLRHQEHLSYGEIAQLLDMPLGTVKTYLFRARQALSKALQGSGEAPGTAARRGRDQGRPPMAPAAGGLRRHAVS